ncbi:hypothetical protein FRX31_004210 [Thalictrum thalictroides]|uniref:DUF4283 domain-containing protein n=1 Tax=Thalictrum thalictroides TaxID=46969 RepID=A0A7J6X9S0_THATH|nr:hypothetical protein FRX31_004210 [Thalictrum thalictroides]
MEQLEIAANRKWSLISFPDVIELGGIKDVDEQKWRNTLIGSIHSKKWFDNDEVKRELIRNWKIKNKFEFGKIADGIFSVKFLKDNDLHFVLNNGPWDIHGYIISFKLWDKDIILEDFEFPYFPVWIQIFGLPIERQMFVKSVQLLER